MSAVKSGLIGAAAVGGLIVVLFASGAIELSTPEERAAESELVDDNADESSKNARGKKRRKGKRRGRRKGNLDSLGYIGAVDIPEQDRGKTGTTIHDETRAHQGLSLYNPCAWGRQFRKAAKGEVVREARLIDNDGNVLHTWGTDYIPGRRRGWAMAKLSDDGYLYAINARTGFVKLDWDSNTVWGMKKPFHHDFGFGPDGNIYALIEHGRYVTYGGQDFAMLDNGIAVLSPDGELIEEFWLFDVLQGFPPFDEHVERRLRKNPPSASSTHDEDEDEDEFGTHRGRILFGRDLFHANTVNFVTETIDGVVDAGDIITSIREMNLVVVLDKKTHKPKWHWGRDTLERQHDPEQLPGGNFLVFDNGRGRKWSRVVEVDPRTGEVVWDYKHDDFFSNIRGLSQRLPNGGTLIVSSQRGRAFEVTPDGEIVWEYWSPDTPGNKVRLPFRMERLTGKPLAFAQAQLDAGKGNPDGARSKSKQGASTTPTKTPDGGDPSAVNPEASDAPLPSDDDKAKEAGGSATPVPEGGQAKDTTNGAAPGEVGKADDAESPAGGG